VTGPVAGEEVVLDGLRTAFAVQGSGPPVLLFAPGGFDAAADRLSTQPTYRDLQLVERLRAAFTIVTFDKRGAGRSGDRVEAVTWHDYARQGTALLEHLGLGRAHLLGGCIGCSIALTAALDAPAATGRLVLLAPAGGPWYRLGQHERVAAHLAHVADVGLAAAVDHAVRSADGFAADPRVGPWAGALRRDPALAEDVRGRDPEAYRAMVAAMGQSLFDRDTVPGPDARDLMGLQVPALIVAGRDRSHAPSAAQYLAECLPQARLADAPLPDQAGDRLAAQITAFLLEPDGAVDDGTPA
jgi:pimeloyl-ACP methyl ester carboxylesterase